MSAARPTENRTVNETITNDDNRQFLNNAHQTQTSSHYENVHIHPQQEMTRLQDVQVHVSLD